MSEANERDGEGLGGTRCSASSIDFSVLLQDPATQSYREALQVQEIMRYHAKEAIRWLRLNSHVIAKAYDIAEFETKPNPDAYQVVDLVALLVLVRTFVRV